MVGNRRWAWKAHIRRKNGVDVGRWVLPESLACLIAWRWREMGNGDMWSPDTWLPEYLAPYIRYQYGTYGTIWYNTVQYGTIRFKKGPIFENPDPPEGAWRLVPSFYSKRDPFSKIRSPRRAPGDSYQAFISKIQHPISNTVPIRYNTVLIYPIYTPIYTPLYIPLYTPYISLYGAKYSVQKGHVI